MRELPLLDAHTHLDASRPAEDLAVRGAALAMTLSLAEAEDVLACAAMVNGDLSVVWGVGCHPGALDAQKAFDRERFRRLAERTAVIGEIGLDFASVVPRARQRETLRAELEIAAQLGRPVSVHSQNAVTAALDELERVAPEAVIMHWWTGSDEETARAVGLGCFFSIPAVLATDRDFSAVIPPDRLLVETDSGYSEPFVAVSAKLREAERLLSLQYGMEPERLRRLVWSNFRDLIQKTRISDRLPDGIRAQLDGLPDP